MTGHSQLHLHRYILNWASLMGGCWMRGGSVEQWVECNPVSTCWLRTLCNLVQCIGQIAETVQASTPPPTSCSSRHSCRHPFSLCHASILHAPLPASISPRNAHCKLQTIAHSLSVHMYVSPCACVRVCVCFRVACPSCVRGWIFADGRRWIAATVQASIDDMATLLTSRHSCRHLSLHCLCAASMLHA